MKFERLLEDFQSQSSSKVMQEWGEILEELMEEIEESDCKLYKEYYRKFYLSLYGPHLNWEKISHWTSAMKNEDGTTGAHWSLAETSQVAAKYGIDFSKFTKEEWYAVLNMVYSDFYGALPDNIDSYVKVAWKWLDDKDVPEGKLYYYYCDVVNAKE